MAVINSQTDPIDSEKAIPPTHPSGGFQTVCRTRLEDQAGEPGTLYACTVAATAFSVNACRPVAAASFASGGQRQSSRVFSVFATKDDSNPARYGMNIGRSFFGHRRARPIAMNPSWQLHGSGVRWLHSVAQWLTLGADFLFLSRGPPAGATERTAEPEVSFGAPPCGGPLQTCRDFVSS